MTRAARTLAVVAMGLSSLAMTRTASALDAGKEQAAKAALKRASEKYLATDFVGAMALLKKAARACAGARCSPATRAALLRDLGVMQLREGDKAAAQKSFTEALVLAPDLTLGRDYGSPDVRAAFDAAKGRGDETGQPMDPGDFTHTPATEQKVNTPLPVYAEISSTEVARVGLKYKGDGMKNWARLPMKRVGAGWGALIPCGAVTAGTMRYWMQGFDSNGDPTASSGDPKHPFQVPIRSEIASEAPRLPGRAAPQTCEEGSAPEEAPPEHEEEPAEAVPEAEKGPSPESSRYARWWVGLAGAIDFLSLPGGTNLCALTSSAVPLNTNGYYCTNPNGSDFPSRTDSSQNSALITGHAGQVASGLHPGDVRAFVAVDYALTPQILIGGRLGYVMNGYPTGGAAVVQHHAFGSKIHVEARGTYVFGDAPLAHEGFAPTVFVAAGAAEFDGHVASVASMSQKATSAPPISQPVDVWLTSGPLFLAAGGGARYQFSPRAAFNAALRVNVAFGGVGALFTYGPEIAVQYGF